MGSMWRRLGWRSRVLISLTAGLVAGFPTPGLAGGNFAKQSTRDGAMAIKNVIKTDLDAVRETLPALHMETIEGVARRLCTKRPGVDPDDITHAVYLFLLEERRTYYR